MRLHLGLSLIISKLKTCVEKTDEEDDTLDGKFTVRVVFPSTTAAAAPDPKSVVGLCARSREPEWVEGGGGKVLGGQGGARLPPGSQALHLLSPLLPFHLFFPLFSAFQHSNPLKAHLVIMMIWRAKQ